MLNDSQITINDQDDCGEVNAAEVLEHCTSAITEMLPQNIEVHMYTSADSIPVRCPASVIESTLINIAYHALRLLTKGGHFVIVASLEQLLDPDNEFRIPAGSYCRIICTELHAFPQKVSEREHALANESLTRSISNLLASRDKRLLFGKLEGGNCIVNLLFN
ncbi:hypothetical protein IJT17_00245 [bacterium]|nr:hypothetical protein [bacterium]